MFSISYLNFNSQFNFSFHSNSSINQIHSTYLFTYLPLLTRLGPWRIHGSNQTHQYGTQCLIG
ncbi:hypothetical protein F383_05234 [Gossypium arboreum]|uniref:Uncharacterized protein n=1 Tax=Gossypium arboreum TaxID=29729 RepID=A0A0B0NRQ8_GOSAR|nr:hypothetical protein F383_05234 [Gossypium arboreum]